MKKLFFTFFITLAVLSYGQAPQEISYQGVARNASGSVLANQNIGIKLDLHQGSAGGAVVFSETHSKTTNSFGLFTLGIGSINTVSFASINWANGPYYLEVSMDPAGGTAYTSVGTQQFMSVPYALYAKTAGNVTTYSAGSGINVTGNTISNTAPDQTVILNAAGATTVSGTYPNFTINTPGSITYSAGNGIDITGGVITNTASAVTPTIVGTGATTVIGVYPNLTITSPTTQVYTAGNGIDITGGVISNTAAAAVTPTIVGTGATTVTGVYPNLTINTPSVSPDQIVSLTGTGTATVTGAYPNFTVDVPAGSSLPTGFNGQFLFNNGTIWDTLPRPNLFFDGTNFGVGTTAPQANFHVVGGGRFDASVSTPQIYTDNIKITGGNAGQVLTSDAIGNGTWQAIPSPTLSYNNGTNVLTLTQGTVVTTATLVGTGSNTVSMVGSGLATVTPTTGSTFTVNVPSPTYTNVGPTTITGTYPNYTVSSTSSPSTTLVQGSNVILNNSGTTYTVSAVTPTITGTGATTVTGTYPNLTINTPTATAATPPTIVGAGATTVTSSGNTFTVNTPASQTYTNGAGISITSGSVITNTAPNQTITLNGTGATTVTGGYPNFTISSPTVGAAVTQTLTGTGISSVTTGANTFTVNTPMPTYVPTTGILNFGGTNTVVATPSLSIAGNILRSGPATNTVTLPATQTYTNGAGISITSGSIITNTAPNQTITLNGTGATTVTGSYPNFTVSSPSATTTSLTPGLNVTVSGTAPNYTVSAPAYSISIPGGNVVQITNGVSTSTSAINATSLTLTGTNNNILSAGGNTVALNTYTPGTGISMTGTAPNYTLSSPNQSLSVSGNSLSITGANTVTIPTTSVVAGNANIIVNQAGNTFSVSGIASPLSLTGTTLTSGPATNSVSLSSLAVWSNSVGVLYPTTLTNSVGVGTTGPLTDKMEINHASTTASTHLHLKQVGGDAFSRIKFTNAIAPTKFWLSTVTSAASDVNSGYNFFYNNGTIGHNIFTVAGDGLVSVNTFSTMNNARFYVGGKVKIDSTLTMAAYFSQPATSPGNEGRIYFDRTSQKFKVSENGGAYVDMIGGAGSSPWLQGSGIITQNNPGDLVGIGTVAPTSQLHVYGSSDPLQITVESAAGNFKTGYHIKTALSEWFMGQDGSTSTGFRITDRDAFAVRFQIDQDGRVGLGTTSATERLDVNGSVKLDSSLLFTGITSVPPTSFGGNGRIYFDQSSGKFKVSENGGPYVDLLGGPSAWVQGAGMVTQQIIGDIVGIGTPSPDAFLDVENNTMYDGIQLHMNNNTNGSNALQVTHYGTGKAGYFEINNASSNADVIFASTNGNGKVINAATSGLGHAGQFVVNNLGSGSHAIYATSNADTPVLRAINTRTSDAGGGVASFEIIDSNNGAGVVGAQTAGNGNVITATTFGNGQAGDFNISNSSNGAFALRAATNGVGPAFRADQYGTGRAGEFLIYGATNTMAAIHAQSGGLGGAGYFETYNTSNTNNAITAVTYGTGNTIFANQLGTAGHAGHFNIPGGSTNTSSVLFAQNIASGTAVEALASTGKAVSAINASNTSPAVYINNTGTGGALHVNGPTRISDGTQGAGKILTSDAAGNATWQFPSPGTGWNLSGNSLTGTEFLGSLNAQDVVFKAGNIEMMRLKSSNAMTFTAGQYSMTASTAVNPALTIAGANFQSTQLNLKTISPVTVVGNLGSISFSDGSNSTSQAYIQGQREAASGGASDLPTALLFFTTADGSGTEGERMRINNAGKVGIGTQVPSAMIHAVNAATTGSAGRFDNNSSSNTADAVFVSNSGTGAGVHVAATATSTVGLWLENAHMKSTASVSPGTATVSVSGITSIALTPTGCTDVKGNILAVVTHTGNIALGNSVTYRVTFAKPYQTAPTVILTPTTDFGIMSYYISTINTTSFNVTIRCTANSGETRTNFGLNYWVIE